MCAASGVLAFGGPALADRPADIGESVEALRQKIGAVGVSIAIVEDGKTTLARGWGPRKLGETAPVDAETLFQTGSTGKAMTGAALAIQIGRAACRERVGPYGSICVGAVTSKKKNIQK